MPNKNVIEVNVLRAPQECVRNCLGHQYCLITGRALIATKPRSSEVSLENGRIPNDVEFQTLNNRNINLADTLAAGTTIRFKEAVIICPNPIPDIMAACETMRDIAD